MARTRDERVHHVLKIEKWRFDYSFGVGDPKFTTRAYSDLRHVELSVTIQQPVIRAKSGLVRLFASAALVGAENEPRQKFGDRLAGKPDAVKPVGRVWYRGDGYQAVLNFPGDMLAPMLTMLAANKYRYVTLIADKGGRETPVYDFTLAEFHGDEPDLAASWDDA
ncbi:hypothetical protein [Bradyrhizobium sp. SEMIA]|uniref:hypothetical protein n=1 Tax=Bradyrhizobium sp. SEMIA TaxID=2597515 RepID=UPI0018A57F66|nr:hypothetical protein [Bradyrhizobium sp. SEMIA]QOG17921.1 hypothetical protein FOM02_11780 [Bradyrhizobium sp. SEMIA]